MSDRDEPTSHEYLYEMDRENLFTLFVGAVASLKVNDDGAQCRSAEAQGLSRMARAVQGRADSSIPREDRLCSLAVVTRVLLSQTDDHDQGRESYWHMPLPELAAYFVRLRGEVGDFIPAASPEPVPDDPSGMGAVSPVHADSDGRLWGQLDPQDEVWSDEQVAALPMCPSCGEPLVPEVSHTGCKGV